MHLTDPDLDFKNYTENLFAIIWNGLALPHE
jgi:hypothetical protein